MSTFEDRVQERRRQFKKGVDEDDARRNREDEAVQLRKKDKEEQMAKKRIQEVETVFGGGPQTPPNPINNNSLEFLVQQVRNYSNHEQQFQATQCIRRQLSIELNPPIGEVIESGVVPDFIKLLSEDSRPDIQFEAAWALTNIASGTAEQTHCVIDAGAIPIFVNLLKSPNDDVCEQAVWALGNIAGDSARCRDLVLQANALHPVLEQTKKNNKISMMRNATWTLSNFCRSKPAPELQVIEPVLGAIAELLYKSDVEVLTDACWALSYFSEGDSKRIQCVIDSGVVSRMVVLLGHNNPLVQTPALRVLGNIVTGDDNQTQIAIRCGALHALKEMLNHQKKGIRKEACWTISNITAGNKEQIQEVINSGLIAPLVDMLKVADFEVKKEVCWVISNATSGGSEDQIRGIVNEGAIPPLCDMLDQRDPKLIMIALEALENILRVGLKDSNTGINPYCATIEACGGLDKVEKLQNADYTAECNDQAQKVLSYFPLEADGMEDIAPDMGFGGAGGQNFNFGGQ